MALALLAPLAFAGGALADLVLPLNCLTSNGSPGCTVNGTNYGTITIVDNVADGSKVDVTIDLNFGTKLQNLLLNWDDATFPKGGAWSVTGTGSPTVATGEDSLQQTPYDGLFDIEITFSGNFTEPVTITLALESVDLNPSDFNFTVDLCAGGGACPAGFNEVFASVHVQNCADIGNPPGCSGPGGSINSAGSLGEGGTGGAQVPAPATVMLLGSGLLAAAGLGGAWGWRRKK